MIKHADPPPSEYLPANRPMPLSWLLPVVICVLALRIALLICDRGFSSYDDGVAAEGARLILHGEVPYRDFWTIYSPGSFYLNALGLAVLGENLLSIRTLWLVQAGIQALLLWAILKRVGCKAVAIAAASALYLVLMPLGTLTFWFTSMLFTAYALVHLMEHPQSGWGYICGFLIGLTALLRQDIGAYLLLAVLPISYAATPGTGRERLKPVLRITCMVVAVAAVVLTYFAANRALLDLWDQTVRFAALQYPGSRPLPYPVPWQQVLIIGPYSAPIYISFLYQLYAFYLMPIALLLCGILYVRSCRRDGWDTTQTQIVAIICLALITFLMVRVRPSGARIVASATLSALAYAALASDKNRLLRIGAISALAVSLAAFVPFGAYTVYALRTHEPRIIGGKGLIYTAGIQAERLTYVATRIKELTSPSERILAGTPVLYFLSDRDPVTRYYEPHPRMTNTPKTQRAIICDMEKNHMRYFIRSLEWGKDTYFTMEPQCQPKALIGYIEKNYKLKYDYRQFRIYERKTPFPNRGPM